MFSNLLSCFNRSRRLSNAIFIRVDDQRRGTSKDLYSFFNAYNVLVNWFFLTKNEKGKLYFVCPRSS